MAYFHDRLSFNRLNKESEVGLLFELKLSAAQAGLDGSHRASLV